MKATTKKVDCGIKSVKNPIQQMVEDKKRIIKAIKNGQDISTLAGIKIVSPL